MEKKEIKTFNVITLGDSGVGKTSIINRYVKNKFNDNITSTLGLNFSYKEIKFNNNGKIILKLVDTAGQEKYRAWTKSYYKNVDVALFIFSLEEKESFDKINDWMESLKNNNNKEGILKYLVGTKNDLEIKVEQSLIDKFVKENTIPYMSTSAKDNKNIDELFEEIGNKLYENFQDGGDKGQTKLKIEVIKKQKASNCCFATTDA